MKIVSIPCVILFFVKVGCELSSGTGSGCGNSSISGLLLDGPMGENPDERVEEPGETNQLRNNVRQVKDSIMFVEPPVFEEIQLYAKEILRKDIDSGNLQENISQVHSNDTIDMALCGYPPICDYETCQQLNITSDPLSMCENAGGREIFVFAVVLLAIFTIIGNCLLPIAVWRSQAMRSHHNALKVSLSISDLIVGIILISTVIPNIEMTMNSTESEIVDTILRSENTIGVVLSGSVLILSSQASLFHLAYLSIERFIAIQFPFWLRRRSTRSVLLVLLGIWSLSVLNCLLPIIFKKYFAYQLSTQIFLYVLVSMDVGNFTHDYVYLFLGMVVPYCVMVFFTMITAFIVYRKQKWSKHFKSSRNSREGDSCAKARRNEIRVFQSSVIMILGFSVTVVPYTIVSSLQDYSECNNSAQLAAVTYASFSRGFLNVIIYTVRDKKFRKEVKNMAQLPSWRNGSETNPISLSHTATSQI